MIQERMDWPMLYTGNPVVLSAGMVFFMHMILMDSDNQLAMNLGETYLVTNSGNERLGKKKLDLVIGWKLTNKNRVNSYSKFKFKTIFI